MYHFPVQVDGFIAIADQISLEASPLDVSGVSGSQLDTQALEIISQYFFKIQVLPGETRGFQVSQITGNNFLAPVMPRKGFLQEMERAVGKEIARNGDISLFRQRLPVLRSAL